MAVVNYFEKHKHLNVMKITVDKELKEICKLIISENKTLDEWKIIESDDYFQTCHYEGGFDAIEESFCFSYYDFNKIEWWFQITLQMVKEIQNDIIKEIEVRKYND